MPNSIARSGSSSVLTLPKTISRFSSAAFSKIGANARQGPHQGAQKSTRTIPVLICSLNVESERAVGAMTICSCLFRIRREQKVSRADSKRKKQREFRTRARSVFHLDVAVMLIDQAAGDGQSKTGAILPRREERVEDALSVRLLDAWPLIENTDDGEPTVRQRLRPALDRDLATLRRELHRIE